MKVSYIGLGKLGLPLALVAAKHHDVVGYDVTSWARDVVASGKYPLEEERIDEYLKGTTLKIVDTVAEAVAHGEIVFVVVQTPHDVKYEGATRVPDERVDFDYNYLVAAIEEIAVEAAKQKRVIAVCVMSTVLPGTVQAHVKPVLNEWTKLCYNPAFPAMGTAIPDFEGPEFVLLGVDDEGAAEIVSKFYRCFIDAPVVSMSVASAEATKVFYNSFLTAKICLANTWMEMCEATGANVDDVTRALSLAHRRLLSPRYLKGGMGDAGGCHPRDLIALSAVARRFNMGYDIFGDLARIREAQTDWLAGMCVEEAKRRTLPSVWILGKAFKKGTNLTVGSCATLFKNILDEYAWTKTHEVRQWDPHIDDGAAPTFEGPSCFFVATDHDHFYADSFRAGIPRGSVVVDPWGKMPDIEGVDVVRVGRRA